MNTSPLRLRAFLVLVAALPVLGGWKDAQAALAASDNAGNYASWDSGGAANQGTSFGAWSFSNTSGDGGQNGAFLATGGDLSIATSGKGWGLYANSSQTAAAVRGFTGGSLSVGQQFLISMDNGGVQNGGTVGFGLRNSSGVNRFEFYFIGGTSNYKVNVNGVETDTGIAWSDSGFNLVFSQNSANGYTFSVNGSTSFSGSSGTLAASDIEQVRFFDFNGGGGNNIYFNSIQVVPEPVTVTLVVFAILAVLGTGVSRLRLAASRS